MFSSYALRFTGMGRPPLAYASAMGFNFTVMYLSAAVAFIVCGDGVAVFTVDAKELLLATGTIEAPRRKRREEYTAAVFVICTLMWGSNSLYIINMPAVVSTNCIFPRNWPV